MSHVLVFIAGLCLGYLPMLAASEGRVRLDPKLEQRDLSPELWLLEDRDHVSDQDDNYLFQHAGDFRPHGKKVASFGFSGSTHIGRLYVVNPGEQAQDFVFVLGYPSIDKLEFILVGPSGQVLTRSLQGDRILQKRDASTYRQPHFHVSLPPGESTLYLRIRTEGSVIFRLLVFSPEGFQAQKLLEYCFLLSMFAVLGVMAIYNLLTWLQLRSTAQFIYLVFLFTNFAQLIGSSGFLQHLLDDPRWIANAGLLFFAGATSLLAMILPLHLLPIKLNHPRIHKFVVSLAWLITFTLGIPFYSYSLGLEVVSAFSLLAVVVTMLCGIRSILDGYRPAIFYTFGWICIFIGTIMRTSMIAGVIEPSFLAEWGQAMGTVVQIVLVSLAIADQTRLAEKASYEKIQALNDSLQRESAQVMELSISKLHIASELAHKLNNPLNYIILSHQAFSIAVPELRAHIELIFAGNQDDPEARALEAILKHHLSAIEESMKNLQAGTTKAARTVAEIRALSGVDGTHLEFVLISQMWRNVLAKLRETLPPESYPSGVALVEGERPVYVMSNSIILENAVESLLVKFAGRREVRLQRASLIEDGLCLEFVLGLGADTDFEAETTRLNALLAHAGVHVYCKHSVDTIVFDFRAWNDTQKTPALELAS